jgi:hypothetical protein
LVEKLTIAQTHAIFAEEMSIDDYLDELRAFMASDETLPHKNVLYAVFPLVKENLERNNMDKKELARLSFREELSKNFPLPVKKGTPRHGVIKEIDTSKQSPEMQKLRALIKARQEEEKEVKKTLQEIFTDFGTSIQYQDEAQF